MASLQSIKKRLQGIGSINKMTKAMELVAATKMRRAQEAALSLRPYALSALEILADLLESLGNDEEAAQAKIDFSQFPLMHQREEIKTTLILLVAADKGLAGSFNSSVFKKLEKFLAEEAKRGTQASHEIQVKKNNEDKFVYIAVGQKAIEYLKRKNIKPEAQFAHYGDILTVDKIEPLAQLLSEGYISGRWDKVLSFSTHFRSALKQEVFERQLLPLSFAKIRATVEEITPETGRFAQLRTKLIAERPTRPTEYIIEPSAIEALHRLLPLLFTMQLYHLILEANASEHSARRMAMKNATDNARELIGDLTLEYNRTRQAVVTKEIIEIAGTTAALGK